AFYAELLRLRRENAALVSLSKDCMETHVLQKERTLLVRRWKDSQELFFTLCFSDAGVCCELQVPKGRWHKLLDSSAPVWLGSEEAAPLEVESTTSVVLHLNPKAVVLYQREA
ncbi:MAG: DUF3459 domain-containing protein, partial [Acidobacteriales bacterium]